MASRSDVLVKTLEVGRTLDRAGVLTVDDRERLFALMEREYLKGGPGSGNFGHEGRPGERGGSSTDTRIVQSHDVWQKQNKILRAWKSSERGVPLSDDDINLLKDFRLEEPETLYRGVRISEISSHYTDLSKLEVGQTIEWDDDGPDSWSTDRSKAEMFMIGNGSLPRLVDQGLQRYAADQGGIGLVLRIEASPEDTIVEFDRWIDAVDAYDGYGGQSPVDNWPGMGSEGEVITKPRKWVATVVSKVTPSSLQRSDGFSLDRDKMQLWYDRNTTSSTKGGVGSGDHGHAGRSGKRGGSSRKPTDYKPGYLPQYLLESLVVTKGSRTTQQLEELRARILKNGITEPIWLQYDDDKITILDGNHRIEFAKEFGIDQLPVRVVNRDGADVDPEVVYRKWLSLGGTNRVSLKGGAGSGNFGHEGRPGERGGSADDGVSKPDKEKRGFRSGADKARRMLFEEEAQENMVSISWEGQDPQTVSIREARRLLSKIDEDEEVLVEFEPELSSSKQFDGIPVYKVTVSHSGFQTSEEIAESITKDGLKLGPSWHNRPPSVYFTTSEELAHRYASEYFATPSSGGYGIVEFRIPPNAEIFNDTVDRSAIEGGEKSFRVEIPIPPEYIIHVTTYKAPYRGNREVSESFKSLPQIGYAVFIVEKDSTKSFDFTPDLKLWEKRVINLLKDKRPLNPRPFVSDTIPNDVKSLIEDGLESCQVVADVRSLFDYALKGGVGSGNFGHEGRPGEVGGSSDRSPIPVIIPEDELSDFASYISRQDSSRGDRFEFSAFFILPDDRIVRARDTESHQTLARRLLGVPSAEALQSAISLGWIRLEVSRHGAVFETQSLDQTTLRRIQRLFDDDKIELIGQNIQWSDSENHFIETSYSTMMTSKYVIAPNDYISDYSLKTLPTTWRPWMTFEERMADLVQSYFQNELLILRQSILEQQSLNVALEAAMWASRTEAMLAIFQPIFEELVLFAMNRVAESISGITVDWNLVNTDAVNWSREFAATRVTEITETTREALGRVVADGLQDGKTLDEIANDLESMKDGSGNRIFDRKRAELIAITEVTTVFAEANEKAWIALGYAPARFKPSAHPRCRCRLQPYDAPTGEKVLMWVTSRDERVCTTPINTPWRKIDGCKGLHRMIVSDGALLGTVVP